MKRPAAPPDLMKVIACGCSTKSPCSQKLCSCKSANLSCTSICKCQADEKCKNEHTMRLKDPEGMEEEVDAQYESESEEDMDD